MTSTSRYLAFAPTAPLNDVVRRDERRRCAGSDVRVQVWEQAAATTRVVVLHGGGGNADAMAPVAALAHAAGAEVAVPDLPGYGDTVTERPRSVRYEDWIDVGAAVVGLDPRPAVLVGLSIGGMLAYDVAARVGGGVAAVVATCLIDPQRDDVRRAVSRGRLAGRYGARMLHATRGVSDGVRLPIRWTGDMRKVANDPELVRLCLSDPRGAGSRVPLGFLRSWLESSRPVEPEEFDACPVLLAHPERDRWTPVDLSMPFFNRLSAERELVMLQGAGHFPLESPGVTQLADALTRTIKRVSQ
jgi:alpha-beta hydrolase superfamily lysophospholipase